MSWSYKFRIVDDYEEHTLSNGILPGKVYVIDKQEIGPEGNIDNTLIHFSESLGAVIKSVRQGESYIEEIRLVTMEE